MSNRKSKTRHDKNRERWGVIFALPQTVSLFFLGILPVIIAFILSFYSWNGFSNPVFVGFKNFSDVFHAHDTAIAMKNTTIYTIVYVPFCIGISLILAVLLNKVKGKMFYRAVFFLPQIVTSVAVAVIWSWIYQPQYGVLNMILRMFGHEGIKWLRDTHTAMASVIIMSIWWGLGYNTVLFLAALQNVSSSYVDAAKVDGAGNVAIFFHITLPMISPTTLLVTITSLINSFQVFDQCYLLTKGGPAKRTYTMAIYIYETAFKQFKLGKASAISLIMFVIIVAVSIVQFKLSNKCVNYDA